MTTVQLLQTVREITQSNIDFMAKYGRKMTESQLAWVSNPGIWSVSQIIAHVNGYGKYYHPVFTKKITNTRFTSTKEAFISSPLGRSAWKSMKLGRLNNIKRKFRAQKGNNPSYDASLVTGRDVETFIQQQEDFLAIIEQAATVNLRRVKIPISISKIVRLRLGDALLFVTYHNQRHIQQIINLKDNRNFPKK